MAKTYATNQNLIEWAEWQRTAGKVVPCCSGESIEYRLAREGAGAAKQKKHAPVITHNELAVAIETKIASMPKLDQSILKFFS